MASLWHVTAQCNYFYNPRDMINAILRETAATVVTFPPSYLDLLSAEDVAGLRCLITAGEAAHTGKVNELAGQVACYNAYGPTECAVCVSVYRVVPKDQGRHALPVGKPL